MAFVGEGLLVNEFQMLMKRKLFLKVFNESFNFHLAINILFSKKLNQIKN